MLQIENLHVHYGRMQALNGISLNVAEGEVVGIIGPNGAGKSTLMTAIAGGLRPSRGDIRLSGRALGGLRPDRIARLGLTLVPEGRHVFSTLSVHENLLIGSYVGKAGPTDIGKILDYFPRLKERLRLPAGRLSGGEQQMLAIGRALLTGPRLMMIDEPSLGLAPKIVGELYEILLQLRHREGLTLLVNEQSASRLLGHADRVYVLREGQIRLHGSASALRSGHALSDAYFGHESSTPEEIDV